MLQPVGAVILGALIFSAAPSPLRLAGVAVVLGGVGVATLTPRRVRAMA